MGEKVVRYLVVPCRVCSFSAVVAYKGRKFIVEPCLCVYVAEKNRKGK
jgi:hypothetical protein